MNRTTMYAIRAVMYLAGKGLTPKTEICSAVHIPDGYFTVFSANLRKRGLLCSQKGNGGGYILAKPADEITLFDVIDSIETTTRLVKCMECEDNCQMMQNTNGCMLKEIYDEVQGYFDTTLKNITIADILANKKPGCKQQT